MYIIKKVVGIFYFYAFTILWKQYCLQQTYTEKNLLVNFTFFIRKFIIFIVTLGHTQNVGFLLF